MKLSFLLLITGMLSYLSSFSQTMRFNFNEQNISVEKVLKLIEEQSEYRFFYEEDRLNVNDKINIDIRSNSIEEVLPHIFSQIGNVEYKLLDRNFIVLKSKEDNKRQSKNISGKVTDPSGIPLPGVSVIVKGTIKGVVTDSNGYYSLTNISNDASLMFSFIGMKSQVVEIAGKDVVNVVLDEETIGIGEVVAVGYAFQSKENITGAVSSVDYEQMGSSRPMTNIVQGLSGQVPGIIIRQTSGKPGDDAGSILIRGQGTLGNSSPLVVVDGIVGNLDDVIPHDVSRISVLKDAASASIYGSRSANGVILITTKKGSESKMDFLYNGFVGSQKPISSVDMIWDYPTHMEVMNQAYFNVNKPQPFAKATIDDYRANSGTDPILYPNTNWFKVAFRTAFIQNHNFSARGGTEKVRYLFSVNILNNQGNMKESDFDRYSFRSNTEADINQWFTVGANIYGYWADQETPESITNYYGYLAHSVPGILPRHPDGRVGGPWVPGENASVDNIETNFDNLESSENTSKLIGKFYANFRLSDNLVLNTSFSPAAQYNYTKTQQLVPNVWNFKTNEILRQSSTTTALAETYAKYYKLVGDVYLSYSKKIDRNNSLSFILGANKEYETSRGLYVKKLDLLSDETTVMNAASGENPDVSGSFGDRALMSYFGRINHSFKGKYLTEANVRYDGSSKFSKNERWGLFPSFSCGWRITEEPFFYKTKYLDNLKLKFSWGMLGNNRVDDYGTRALYKLNGYVFGGSVVAGAAPEGIPNEVLKWETTTQTDFGIESDWLRSRLGFDFDWFYKKTQDILLELPIPGVNGGLTPPPQNAGIISNRGIETSFRWNDKIRNHLKYEFSGNFTYVKSRVDTYQGEVATLQDNKILKEGLEINPWYVREVLTIADQNIIDKMLADGYTFSPMPSPGDFIYKDQQKEGEEGYKEINDDDRVVKGSSIPKYIFGGKFRAEYKNFDFSILAQGVAGVDAYFNEIWYTSDLNNGSLISSYALNAWTPDNTSAKFPRLTAGGNANNTVVNDFWLMDASYLRIKNVTLGYSLPLRLAARINMKNLRLYLSAENYLTVKSSSFKGFDPEMTGVSYPLMKTFTIGVNVNF